MSKELLQAIKDRRSYYGISKDSPISDDKIQGIVGDAVKYVPSAFNSQTQRAILLFGADHDALWDIVMETLRAKVPAEKFGPTEDKVNGFKAGHGTVLYFTETAATKELQEKFPSYADNFPIWAQHENGMLQLIIWAALEAEGLGVNIQHYNPIIDDEVKKRFDVPDSWTLIAQMPFGTPTAEPGDKDFLPLDERLKVFGR